MANGVYAPNIAKRMNDTKEVRIEVLVRVTGGESVNLIHPA